MVRKVKCSRPALLGAEPGFPIVTLTFQTTCRGQHPSGTKAIHVAGHLPYGPGQPWSPPLRRHPQRPNVIATGIDPETTSHFPGSKGDWKTGGTYSHRCRARVTPLPRALVGTDQRPTFHHHVLFNSHAMVRSGANRLGRAGSLLCNETAAITAV